MNKTIRVLSATIAAFVILTISSFAQAQRVGGAQPIIDDPVFGNYEGQYKYAYSVTYVDYRGNTVTGTAWEYVDVSYNALSDCQNALNSATFWGATITINCHQV